MGTNRRHRGWRQWGLILSAVLLPSRLFADGAAVILSGNLSSYEEAALGFKKSFSLAFKEYTIAPPDSGDNETIESIRSQRPKVIVAIGSKAAVEALNAFPETPLIYCMVIDPERQGLAGKKNVFGIRFEVEPSVLFSKFKAALPKLRRLGLIMDRARDESRTREISELGNRMGMDIIVEKASSKTDIPGAMRAMSGKIDAFWMTTDPIVTNKFTFNTISDFCLNSRIPLLVPMESLVNAGGFLAVTASEKSIGSEAASLSKDILDGKFPKSDLVQPSEIEISISLKTAKIIGVEIADSVLKISKQLP